MRDIIQTFLAVQGPKFIRHLLALLSGWFAAHHIGADANDPVALFVGITLYLAISLWSALSKSSPSYSYMDMVKALAEAAARHLVAVISGWMASQGGQFQPDTAAIVLFVANYLTSHLQRPDFWKPSAKSLNAAMLCMVALTGCSR